MTVGFIFTAAVFGVAGEASAETKAGVPTSAQIPTSSGGVAAIQNDSLHENTAFFSSLGTTLVGTGMGIGTLVLGAPLSGTVMLSVGLGIGPSIGHIYAHHRPYGLLSAGSRILLIVGGVLAAGFAWNNGAPRRDLQTKLLWAASGVAVIAVPTWAIFDIATAKEAVRKENRRRGFDLSLSPSVVVGERSTALGAVVSASF